MKICIIGAGPAGSFISYLLANHFDIELYENHSEIGRPVQCSGLVTKSIEKIDRIFRGKQFNSLIVNKISYVRLFSEKERFELKLKHPDRVLNREKFDKWLSSLALKKGTKIKLNSEFIRFKRIKEGILVYIKEKGKIKKRKVDILIGADGFFSKVSKRLGNSRDFVPCIQGDYIYNTHPKTMDIFFSKKYKELFAWIVPKNNRVAEIGLGCKTELRKKFKEFLIRAGVKGKALKYTGGPISIYSPFFKIAENNIFLIGEAATFVKATTLGGIIPSLASSKALANALIKGKSYSEELRNLRRRMYLHYMARKILNKFTDKDYDEFLRLCNVKNVKRLLSEYSRDEYSTGFILKLLLAQPKLVKFLIKLFP